MKGMRTAHMRKQQGFSLIELLVVIGIIVVLAAILYPVFQSVREKARQAQCRANLSQIATGLRQYREQYGQYPPTPYYDTIAKRWLGGISALYPDFIPSKAMLICPDDNNVTTKKQQALDECYSSYNGMPDSTLHDFATIAQTNPEPPGTTAIAAGLERTYNYCGFTHEGYDPFTYATRPYISALPDWLRNEGLSWRHYPRLCNRNAPDNTYITHCVHHRRFTKSDTAKFDAVVTLNGTSTMVNISQVGKVGSDPVGSPSKWVTQKN